MIEKLHRSRKIIQNYEKITMSERRHRLSDADTFNAGSVISTSSSGFSSVTDEISTHGAAEVMKGQLWKFIATKSFSAEDEKFVTFRVSTEVTP